MANPFFSLRLIIVPYLVCGGAFGALFESRLKSKTPLPSEAHAGILLVTLLFVAWNIVLYRQARVDPDPAFPTPAYQRYTPPVAATVSFLLGVSLFLLH